MDSYVKSVVERFDRSDITLTELCRRAEIAHSTWQRIRQGKSSPTIRTLDKIETALDTYDKVNAMQRAEESSA